MLAVASKPRGKSRGYAPDGPRHIGRVCYSPSCLVAGRRMNSTTLTHVLYFCLHSPVGGILCFPLYDSCGNTAIVSLKSIGVGGTISALLPCAPRLPSAILASSRTSLFRGFKKEPVSLSTSDSNGTGNRAPLETGSYRGERGASLRGFDPECVIS